MPAGLWRPAVPGPRRRRAPGRDEGFTLVEVIVSIALISIVMTALTSFFVRSLGATSQLSGRQSGTQLAQDALELARGLQGSAVLNGRGHCGVDGPCPTPVTGVDVSDLEEWDYPNGSTALPTAAKRVTVDGTDYFEHWYVGKCWQAAGGGDCHKSPGTGPIMFYRVIVAVFWTNRECTGNACSFVTSTMVNPTATSPLFNSNATAQPPVVTNPGDQTDELTNGVSLPLTVTGGAPPVTWTPAATGLPPGLTLMANGVITGTPTTLGTYTVKVNATDAFSLTGSAQFNWTIVPALTVTTPAAQSGQATVPVTPLTVSAANGVGVYSWSATGLPPGLAIDSTGTISGTPTTVGSYSSVVVKVTDAKNKIVSTLPFTWNVGPTITGPTGTQTVASGTAVNVQMTVTPDPFSPLTWTATSLPPGLAINAGTGVISGTVGAGTRYLSTVTVKDSKGQTDSAVVVWSVTGGSPRITSPNGDRTDNLNANVTVTPSVSGGTSPYTWTATGLPNGISINSGTGKMSGKPNTLGTSTVTLKVTDKNGLAATFMFTWTIQ